jgi:hypothetical protein
MSPFPGMDPYIERPAIWGDFHDSLITFIRGALQPLLRPRYAAVIRDRLYVIESGRPIYPDVSVVRTRDSGPSSAVAIEEPDAPAVFELWREQVHEPLIHIIEPAGGNRIVTAIEVLSPDNKAPGPGRDSYLQKREEFWNAEANLVEIDLLREGELTVRVSSEKLAALQPWHYLSVVTRTRPSRQEIYPMPLQQRLKRIAIPLSTGDKDVTLDLQTVFARSWDEGPYPELLHYDNPPPGKMTAVEISWCNEVLIKAGHRAVDSSKQ